MPKKYDYYDELSRALKMDRKTIENMFPHKNKQDDKPITDKEYALKKRKMMKKKSNYKRVVKKKPKEIIDQKAMF